MYTTECDFRNIKYCEHPTWVPAGWFTTSVGMTVGIVMCTDCCATAHRNDVFNWIAERALANQASFLSR